MRNIVHTLAFNLYSETEKAVIDLYHRNDHSDFEHVLVDLGFPLEDGDKIPDNIDLSKDRNSSRLQELADQVGSRYLKIENIGVSQNWDMVARLMKVDQGDALICCDPDEIVHTDGWVNALSIALRSTERKYGWVSLTMPEHFPVLTDEKLTKFRVGDIRVWEVKGRLNWAQGAMSGSMIREIGTIPSYSGFPVYGHLETAVMDKMTPLGYTWSILPDFTVSHTDDVPLYRQWKDQIIFGVKKTGQIGFERWLEMKRRGEL